MPVVFQDLPSNVKTALTDFLPSFESASSDDRTLLLQAAENGVRLEVFNSLDPGAKSLGWRVAAWTGGSAIAADIYTMERQNGLLAAADTLPDGTARLACVRKGVLVAQMLLQVEREQQNHAAEVANVAVALLAAREVFTEALLIGAEKRVAAYYTLIKKNPPPLRVAMDKDSYLKLVQPIAEQWLAVAQNMLQDPVQTSLKLANPDNLPRPAQSLLRKIADRVGLRFPPQR